MTDVEPARNWRFVGVEPSRRPNLHEQEVVAYHEAGHAIVASVLPGVDPVQAISIAPHGPVILGATLQRLSARSPSDRSAALKNQLAVLLAGAAAEELVFSVVSAGAQNDLQRATDLACAILPDGEKDSRDDGRRRWNARVRALLVEARARAYGVLQTRRDALTAIARRLADQRVVDESELRALLEQYPDPGHSANGQRQSRIAGTSCP